AEDRPERSLPLRQREEIQEMPRGHRLMRAGGVRSASATLTSRFLADLPSRPTTRSGSQDGHSVRAAMASALMTGAVELVSSVSSSLEVWACRSPSESQSGVGTRGL